ncbi:hypothetical protein BESB_022860 [Besnoitia besnoiti]|uniref:Uncharacterized protein n=1 Tax=Besnoitia besnoiti TaxID=94643 RepID=A0A2A9M3J9_BESBE|nr:hypothetical protein BESB_022860 [Besnoitia besnoiti]PFH31794.1 hypothetical protein BESB_022860 [Besnoitia besnoiti]
MEAVSAVHELFNSCRGGAWPLVSVSAAHALLKHHLRQTAALPDEDLDAVLAHAFPDSEAADIDFLSFWKGMETLLASLGLQDATVAEADARLRGLQFFRDRILQVAHARRAQVAREDERGAGRNGRGKELPLSQAPRRTCVPPLPEVLLTKSEIEHIVRETSRSVGGRRAARATRAAGERTSTGDAASGNAFWDHVYADTVRMPEGALFSVGDLSSMVLGFLSVYVEDDYSRREGEEKEEAAEGADGDWLADSETQNPARPPLTPREWFRDSGARDGGGGQTRGSDDEDDDDEDRFGYAVQAEDNAEFVEHAARRRESCEEDSSASFSRESSQSWAPLDRRSFSSFGAFSLEKERDDGGGATDHEGDDAFSDLARERHPGWARGSSFPFQARPIPPTCRATRELKEKERRERRRRELLTSSLASSSSSASAPPADARPRAPPRSATLRGQQGGDRKEGREDSPAEESARAASPTSSASLLASPLSRGQAAARGSAEEEGEGEEEDLPVFGSRAYVGGESDASEGLQDALHAEDDRQRRESAESGEGHENGATAELRARNEAAHVEKNEEEFEDAERNREEKSHAPRPLSLSVGLHAGDRNLRGATPWESAERDIQGAQTDDEREGEEGEKGEGEPAEEGARLEHGEEGTLRDGEDSECVYPSRHSFSRLKSLQSEGRESSGGPQEGTSRRACSSRLGQALRRLADTCAVRFTSRVNHLKQIQDAQRWISCAVEAFEDLESCNSQAEEDIRAAERRALRLRSEKSQLLERLKILEAHTENQPEEGKELQALQEQLRTLQSQVKEQKRELIAKDELLRRATEERDSLQTKTSALQRWYTKKVEDVTRVSEERTQQHQEDVETLKEEKEALERELALAAERLRLTQAASAAAAAPRDDEHLKSSELSRDEEREKNSTLREQLRESEDARETLQLEVEEKDALIYRLKRQTEETQEKLYDLDVKLRQASRLVVHLRQVRDDLLKSQEKWRREAAHEREKMVKVFREAAEARDDSSPQERGAGSLAAATALRAEQQIRLLQSEREIQLLRNSLSAAQAHIRRLDQFIDELRQEQHASSRSELKMALSAADFSSSQRSLSQSPSFLSSLCPSPSSASSCGRLALPLKSLRRHESAASSALRPGSTAAVSAEAREDRRGGGDREGDSKGDGGSEGQDEVSGQRERLARGGGESAEVAEATGSEERETRMEREAPGVHRGARSLEDELAASAEFCATESTKATVRNLVDEESMETEKGEEETDRGEAEPRAAGEEPREAAGVAETREEGDHGRLEGGAQLAEEEVEGLGSFEREENPETAKDDLEENQADESAETPQSSQQPVSLVVDASEGKLKAIQQSCDGEERDDSQQASVPSSAATSRSLCLAAERVGGAADASSSASPLLGGEPAAAESLRAAGAAPELEPQGPTCEPRGRGDSWAETPSSACPAEAVAAPHPTDEAEARPFEVHDEEARTVAEAEARRTEGGEQADEAAKSLRAEEALLVLTRPTQGLTDETLRALEREEEGAEIVGSIRRKLRPRREDWDLSQSGSNSSYTSFLVDVSVAGSEDEAGALRPRAVPTSPPVSRRSRGSRGGTSTSSPYIRRKTGPWRRGVHLRDQGASPSVPSRGKSRGLTGSDADARVAGVSPFSQLTAHGGRRRDERGAAALRRRASIALKPQRRQSVSDERGKVRRVGSERASAPEEEGRGLVKEASHERRRRCSDDRGSSSQSAARKGAVRDEMEGAKPRRRRDVQEEEAWLRKAAREREVRDPTLGDPRRSNSQAKGMAAASRGSGGISKKSEPEEAKTSARSLPALWRRELLDSCRSSAEGSDFTSLGSHPAVSPVPRLGVVTPPSFSSASSRPLRLSSSSLSSSSPSFASLPGELGGRARRLLSAAPRQESLPRSIRGDAPDDDSQAGSRTWLSHSRRGARQRSAQMASFFGGPESSRDPGSRPETAGVRTLSHFFGDGPARQQGRLAVQRPAAKDEGEEETFSPLSHSERPKNPVSSTALHARSQSVLSAEELDSASRDVAVREPGEKVDGLPALKGEFPLSPVSSFPQTSSTLEGEDGDYTEREGVTSLHLVSSSAASSRAEEESFPRLLSASPTDLAASSESRSLLSGVPTSPPLSAYAERRPEAAATAKGGRLSWRDARRRGEKEREEGEEHRIVDHPSRLASRAASETERLGCLALVSKGAEENLEDAEKRAAQKAPKAVDPLATALAWAPSQLAGSSPASAKAREKIGAGRDDGRKASRTLGGVHAAQALGSAFSDDSTFSLSSSLRALVAAFAAADEEADKLESQEARPRASLVKHASELKGLLRQQTRDGGKAQEAVRSLSGGAVETLSAHAAKAADDDAARRHVRLFHRSGEAAGEGNGAVLSEDPVAGLQRRGSGEGGERAERRDGEPRRLSCFSSAGSSPPASSLMASAAQGTYAERKKEREKGERRERPEETRGGALQEQKSSMAMASAAADWNPSRQSKDEDPPTSGTLKLRRTVSSVSTRSVGRASSLDVTRRSDSGTVPPTSEDRGGLGSLGSVFASGEMPCLGHEGTADEVGSRKSEAQRDARPSPSEEARGEREEERRRALFFFTKPRRSGAEDDDASSLSNSHTSHASVQTAPGGSAVPRQLTSSGAPHKGGKRALSYASLPAASSPFSFSFPTSFWGESQAADSEGEAPARETAASSLSKKLPQSQLLGRVPSKRGMPEARETLRAPRKTEKLSEHRRKEGSSRSSFPTTASSPRSLLSARFFEAEGIGPSRAAAAVQRGEPKKLKLPGKERNEKCKTTGRQASRPLYSL